MSTMHLIVPQLEQIEKYYAARHERTWERVDGMEYTVEYTEDWVDIQRELAYCSAWIEAMKAVKLMFMGIDVASKIVGDEGDV